MIILIVFISIFLSLTAATTVHDPHKNKTIADVPGHPVPSNNKTIAVPYDNTSTEDNKESKNESNSNNNKNNNNNNINCKTVCDNNQNCIKLCEAYAKNPNRHPLSAPQCGLSKLTGEVPEFVNQELRRKTSKSLQPKWPWMVSLQYQRRMNQTSTQYRAHFCTGVIIHENFVLSSAHCVPSEPGSYELMIGTNSLSVNDKKAQILEIESLFVPGLVYKPWIIKHDDYEESAIGNNDLLLIKTAQKIIPKVVEYDFVVNPICLPEPNYKPEGLARIVGWGYTGVNLDMITTMVETDNPIIENERADKVIKGTRHYFGDKGEYFIYNVTINDKDLCTMANIPPGLGDQDIQTLNSSIFFGDSGSPLFKIIDNRAFDLGVAHWISGGQTPISMWARISSYTKWLEENMKKTVWEINNRPKKSDKIKGKEPDSKSDPKSDHKSDHKSDPKADPKADPKSNPKSDPKSELKSTKKPNKKNSGKARALNWTLPPKRRFNSRNRNKKTAINQRSNRPKRERSVINNILGSIHR